MRYFNVLSSVVMIALPCLIYFYIYTTGSGQTQTIRKSSQNLSTPVLQSSKNSNAKVAIPKNEVVEIPGNDLEAFLVAYKSFQSVKPPNVGIRDYVVEISQDSKVYTIYYKLKYKADVVQLGGEIAYVIRKNDLKIMRTVYFQ